MLVLVEVETGPGETTTQWVCEDRGGPGGPGDDDDDSGDEPTCDLTNIADYDYWYEESGGNIYCMGDVVCASRVPSVLDEEFWPPDRPEPWSIWTDTQCFDEDGILDDWWENWFTPPEPPIYDQAMAAYQNLSTPEFSLSFGPTSTAYVGTKTYFWADLTSAGELSSQAFTVTATATPRSITVDPGNGGSIDCGWATSQTEDCVKKYLETASGQSAFEASATLHYDVTFTMNGGPLPAADLARLPDSLDSPAEAAAVPVDEVQVIVE